MNGSGQGSRELSTQSAARAPLPGALRVAIYAVGALLWISGAVWLVLHHAFPQASAFGVLPNPWEAPLMRVHGLIAVCAVFLIGWMSAAHVTTRWSSDRNRRSGLALGVTALLLVFSGYALYYTIGSPHDTTGFLHEALGLLSPAAAVAHWWRNRSRT
jgi:succinate dehydrogenase hydrophobic anchor subunit